MPTNGTNGMPTNVQSRHFPRERTYAPPNGDYIIPNISSTFSISSSQSTSYRDLSEDRLTKKRKSNPDTQSLESFKHTFGTTQNRRPPGRPRSTHSQSSQPSLSDTAPTLLHRF